MMNEQFDIEYQKLLNNPATRVPICLCLDVSGSMDDNGKIDQLNQGLKDFIDALYEDEIARDSAELCIITVGSNSPELISNFQDVESLKNNRKIGNFTAGGYTPLGAAVQMAVELLNERKELYKETDTDYYQPWLVIMSDGAPTDKPIVQATIPIIRKMIQDKKLYGLSVIIGDYDDGADLLGQFSSAGKAHRVEELNMREFFRWLSSSVSRVSQSTPGTSFDLFNDAYDAKIFLK